MKAFKFFQLLEKAKNLEAKTQEIVTSTETLVSKAIETEKQIEVVAEEVKQVVDEATPVIQSVIEEVKTPKKKKNEQPAE
jgi:hypothetical protein